MRPFEYIKAATLSHATELLSSFGSDACILAGGTDLLIEFRRTEVTMPKVVVDISGVRELNGIVDNDGTIVIKPLATHAMIQESAILQRHASLLSLAASWIGSPQIRNRGTVGGNIMNAAACADTVPPLIALDAEITLQSKSGMRTMNLADLFVKPYDTRANPDDILTEIRFAKLSSNATSTFIKLGRRNAVSISRLSVAVILAQNEAGIITDAHIVPGAAFPVWRRITEAERMLVGEKPAAGLFRAAGDKVSEVMITETDRRWSTAYKEPVIAVLVRRGLEQCLNNNSQLSIHQ